MMTDTIFDPMPDPLPDGDPDPYDGNTEPLATDYMPCRQRRTYYHNHPPTRCRTTTQPTATTQTLPTSTLTSSDPND